MKNISFRCFFLFFILVDILSTSCTNNSTKKENERIQDSIRAERLTQDSIARQSFLQRHIDNHKLDSLRQENSALYRDSLFLDFRFGISEAQYEKTKKQLIENGSMFQYSSSGLYAYTLKYNDIIIWMVPYPHFSNNKLDKLRLVCWNSDGSSDSETAVMWHLDDSIHKAFYFDNDKYWFKKGLEIHLCNEMVDNHPYPDTKTGVLYLKQLK